MNTSSEDIQTLPAAQEQEMRAMQNLFQRAANVIVDASKLGEEVRQLREQLRTLLADTDRMREHIQWLEQENQTLRTQRDEAQNTLSDIKNDLDAAITHRQNMEMELKTTYGQRDQARTDAAFWESEAAKTETSLLEVTMRAFNLQNMLESIWGNIKDHFTPKPEPEIAPRVEPETPSQQPEPQTQTQRNIDYWNNPHQHPAE